MKFRITSYQGNFYSSHYCSRQKINRIQSCFGIHMINRRPLGYLGPILKQMINFAPGRDWPSLSKFPHINPQASHALPGAVFHLSKMRAHVAADARVTSGALYLQGPRRVFRGLELGFQGLEFKQPRSGSSATPYTYPEARHAPKKIRNTDGKSIIFNEDMIQKN